MRLQNSIKYFATFSKPKGHTPAVVQSSTSCQWGKMCVILKCEYANLN